MEILRGETYKDTVVNRNIRTYIYVIYIIYIYITLYIYIYIYQVEQKTHRLLGNS